MPGGDGPPEREGGCVMGELLPAVAGALKDWAHRDVDAMASRYAHDAVLHEHATGRTVQGGREIATVQIAWTHVFSDLGGELQGTFTDGDLSGYQVIWTGTHDGPLPLPDGGMVAPTGRRVTVPAAMLHVVRDERIVRQDHYFDALTMLTQLGVMPASAQAAA